MILARNSITKGKFNNIIDFVKRIPLLKTGHINNNMNRWGNNRNSYCGNYDYNRFDNDYMGSMYDYNPFDNHRYDNDYMMGSMQQFAPQNIGCGELRLNNVGQTVRLSGRFAKKRIGRFAEIKDRSGHAQLVIDDKYPNIVRRFAKMPTDCILTIVGTVYRRPQNSINSSALTGEIEVEVEDILNIEFPFNSRPSQKRSYSTMSETKNLGITSTEYKIAKSDNILKYFENRDCTCNDLNLTYVNKEVQLIGWIPNLSKLKFQQLKDGYGQTQIIFEDDMLRDTLNCIPEYSAILVRGKVLARPPNNINNKYPTGEIEVHVTDIKVLNPDEPYEGPVKDKISKMSIEDVTITDNHNNNNINNNDTTIISHGKIADINKFTCRTHNCGELRNTNVGEKVVLCGWLEYQRMNKFLVLRDGYGQIQIMLPENCIMPSTSNELSLETILKVNGKVVPRPSNMINPSMKTGEIEIFADSVEILNEAKKNLPFEVRTFNRAKETLRLEHRYIDLRFNDMQRNLRMRSSVLMKMREYLINYLGFIEVETPTLFRRTPGGAQEFIVPTRKIGHFYSLVQSPQQFKQMLMAGAVDRYFQIARCYRDEATRPDRQPEFTQLDIELSFTNRNSIMQLIEETLLYCWPKELPKISIPFQRMTYDEAMAKYGSDKPDIRFELLFNDVTNILSENDALRKNIEDFTSYTIVVKKPQSYFSHTIKKQLDKIASDYSKSKFIISKIKDIPSFMTGFEKIFTSNVCESLQNELKFDKDDVILMGFGPKRETQIMLGRIRTTYIDILKEYNNLKPTINEPFNFLWITDFPLFERNNIDNEIDKFDSCHHPFTAPFEDDIKKLTDKSELLKIRSQAYDLVLNGEEIGGGSIRIHDKALQEFILDKILKVDHNHLEHLLNALESGCPPHGGIALGLDRLLGVMCNTKSIRDVIAFPKGLDGKDHLSKAPVPISEDEKKLYCIEVIEKTTNNEIEYKMAKVDV